MDKLLSATGRGLYRAWMQGGSNWRAIFIRSFRAFFSIIFYIGGEGGAGLVFIWLLELIPESAWASGHGKILSIIQSRLSIIEEKAGYSSFLIGIGKGLQQ